MVQERNYLKNGEKGGLIEKRKSRNKRENGKRNKAKSDESGFCLSRPLGFGEQKRKPDAMLVAKAEKKGMDD